MSSTDASGFSKSGVVGLFAGFILGSVLGNVIAGILFFNTQDLPVIVLGLIFFGCTIGGAVLGSLIGHRCRRRPRR
jgi:Na+/proline symporter